MKYRKPLPASEYIRAFSAQKKHSDSLSSSRYDRSPTDPDLWTTTGKQFSDWVVTLCCSFIHHAVKDTFLATLAPICEQKSNMAEWLMPYILHDVLRADDSLRGQVSEVIKGLFSRHKVEDIQALQVAIDCVVYLRRSQPPQPRTKSSDKSGKDTSPFQGNFWLNLNFLDIARAAQRCGSHETSLLYLEIWFENEDKSILATNRTGNVATILLSSFSLFFSLNIPCCLF